MCKPIFILSLPDVTSMISKYQFFSFLFFFALSLFHLLLFNFRVHACNHYLTTSELYISYQMKPDGYILPFAVVIVRTLFNILRRFNFQRTEIISITRANKCKRKENGIKCETIVYEEKKIIERSEAEKEL